MLRLVEKIDAHEGICWSVSWCSRGAMLVSSGQDRCLKLWKRDNSKYHCQHSLDETATGHSRTIRRVTWRRDSKCIAACSFDSTCSVWKIGANETMSLLTRISGQESEVKGVSFSPCGEMLATCSRDKSIWIFDVSNLLLGTNGSEPDYNRIVEGDNLEVFDEAEFTFPTSPSIAREQSAKVEEVDCVSVLQGHSQDVKNVKFHPRNSGMLVSVSYDDTVKIWAASGDDWQLVETLKGHTNTVWDLAFNPEANEEFVSVSADGTMRIWTRRSDPFTACQISWVAAGPLGIVSRQRANSRIPHAPGGWSCLTTQVTWSLVEGVPPPPIYSVDWSSGGLIVLGCGDNTIRVFMKSFGSSPIPVSTLKTHSEPTCVAFRPQPPPGQLSEVEIAASFDDGSIAMYSLLVCEVN